MRNKIKKCIVILIIIIPIIVLVIKKYAIPYLEYYRLEKKEEINNQDDYIYPEAGGDYSYDYYNQDVDEIKTSICGWLIEVLNVEIKYTEDGQAKNILSTESNVTFSDDKIENGKAIIEVEMRVKNEESPDSYIYMNSIRIKSYFQSQKKSSYEPRYIQIDGEDVNIGKSMFRVDIESGNSRLVKLYYVVKDDADLEYHILMSPNGWSEYNIPAYKGQLSDYIQEYNLMKIIKREASDGI